MGAKGSYQEISAAKSVITPIDPPGKTDKLGSRGRGLQTWHYFLSGYFVPEAGWTEEIL
jgi:hypothetical protein